MQLIPSWFPLAVPAKHLIELQERALLVLQLNHCKLQLLIPSGFSCSYFVSIPITATLRALPGGSPPLASFIWNSLPHLRDTGESYTASQRNRIKVPVLTALSGSKLSDINFVGARAHAAAMTKSTIQRAFVNMTV